MIPAEDTNGIKDLIHLPQIHALQPAVQFLEICLDLGFVHAVIVAVCFVQERQDGFSIPEVRLVALGVFLQSLDVPFHNA